MQRQLLRSGWGFWFMCSGTEVLVEAAGNRSFGPRRFPVRTGETLLGFVQVKCRQAIRLSAHAPVQCLVSRRAPTSQKYVALPFAIDVLMFAVFFVQLLLLLRLFVLLLLLALLLPFAVCGKGGPLEGGSNQLQKGNGEP